jgi:hypothetical protein
MQSFTARQILQIDIASNFGLEKRSWSERLAWFEDHQGQLLDMLPEAEEPALFYAGIHAWSQVQQGQAIGYPISLDATASGLQILACLTGDRDAAQICNVVNTGRREDAYTTIWQVMQAKAGQSITITRNQVKDAVIPAFFGSKSEPKKAFGDGPLLAIFEETMSELAPACWELNKVYLRPQEKCQPDVRDSLGNLMPKEFGLWDSTALSNDWVLPDNFHVHIPVELKVTEQVAFLGQAYEVNRTVNAPVEKGRSLSANTTHSVDGMIVREMQRRCNYDPAWINLLRNLLTDEGTHFIKGQAKHEAIRMTKILWQHYQDSGYLSARILDYLDGDTIELVEQKPIRELLESLPEKPFQVVSVHDCFRVLPTYGNDLRKQYILQLHLIARSNLLDFILTQLLGHPVTIDKFDPNLADDILDSEYALS